MQGGKAKVRKKREGKRRGRKEKRKKTTIRGKGILGKRMKRNFYYIIEGNA